ncbi:GntR family transcriptional regulator [Streptomyces sparsogenes]|uniref:GntR family transcriptional regulator n=1 Tax=Streptomyces sparsogenes TaxID=67365 RepID=UPI003325D834
MRRRTETAGRACGSARRSSAQRSSGTRPNGVAKMTANQAFKILVTEGLTYARPGSGTYVREFRPIRRVANDRLSKSRWSSGHSIWAADVDRRPLATDVQVYEAEAPHQIGRLLGLGPGAPVLVRSRKYAVEDRPVQIATSYLPADLVREPRSPSPTRAPEASTPAWPSWERNRSTSPRSCGPGCRARRSAPP